MSGKEGRQKVFPLPIQSRVLLEVLRYLWNPKGENSRHTESFNLKISSASNTRVSYLLLVNTVYPNRYSYFRAITMQWLLFLPNAKDQKDPNRVLAITVDTPGKGIFVKNSTI